jgi:hypothetical protein
MMNPKIMARMVRHQYQDLKATLPLADEKPACGCDGCTCGADEKTEKQFDIDKTYQVLTEL